VFESLEKSLVNRFKSRSKERALFFQQSLKHFVINVDNQIKIAGLLAENLVVLVNLHCSSRHFNSKQGEVLDFTQKTNQLRVKVDSKVIRCFITNEQILLEFFLAGVLDFFGPFLDVLRFILSQSGSDGLISSDRFFAFF